MGAWRILKLGGNQITQVLITSINTKDTYHHKSLSPSPPISISISPFINTITNIFINTTITTNIYINTTITTLNILHTRVTSSLENKFSRGIFKPFNILICICTTIIIIVIYNHHQTPKTHPSSLLCVTTV